MAAETLQHHLNGRLAEIVLRAERLRDAPGCPAESQAELKHIIAAALACSTTLGRVGRVRRVRTDRRYPGLDLVDVT